MDNGSIKLKPVKELLGMNFFIPDYQRGYRWTEQQVSDLLADIEEFVNEMEKKPNTQDIYCMQPLVVQNKCNEKEIVVQAHKAETIKEIEAIIKKAPWNVVDGQQRLTTIYLILKFLEKSEIYSLEYQTRKDSANFLNDISNKKIEESQEYIDYFNFYKVYNTVKEWFKEKDEPFKTKFKNVLLEKVNFIWYQIGEDEDPIMVFKRLNIGKIPLTNSELIKALFLNRSNFTDDMKLQQQKIAIDWDNIENTLQNDEFWLFLHSKEYDKPTRIDFILDLIYKQDYKLKRFNASKNEIEQIKKRIGKDEHSVFRYYYELFNNKKNDSEINYAEWLRDFWKENIKKIFQVFREWYYDYQLFHYIGFCTTEDGFGLDILKLYSNYNLTKEQFIKYIKEEIKKNLQKKEWFLDLDKFVFDVKNNNKRVDKRECRPVLLLHNIETIIQQNKQLVSDKKYNLPNFTRFPFHLYKSEKWDIEHIHPNADENLDGDNDKRKYLLLAKKHFEKIDGILCQEIDECLQSNKIEEIKFVNMYEKINELGGPISKKDKNKICNFTLLDQTTNREYQNAIFPEKRTFVINKEKGKKITYNINNNVLIESEPTDEVAFVPICTKNVFTKSYTRLPVSLMSWTDDDAYWYFKDIKEKLNYYLTKNK